MYDLEEYLTKDEMIRKKTRKDWDAKSLPPRIDVVFTN